MMYEGEEQPSNKPRRQRAADIKTNAETIFTGKERDTRNVADEGLLTAAGFVDAVGLISRVCSANTLARSRVKGNGGIKARAGVIEVKCNDCLDRAADRKFASEGAVIFSEDFEALQLGAVFCGAARRGGEINDVGARAAALAGDIFEIKLDGIFGAAVEYDFALLENDAAIAESLDGSNVMTNK